MPSKRKRVRILCDMCDKDHTEGLVRELAKEWGMSTTSIHEIIWEQLGDAEVEPRIELEGAYAVRVDR